MADSEDTAPRRKKTAEERAAWMAANAAAIAARKSAGTPVLTPEVLAPVRHPQRDFYIADLSDIAPKDDMPSMEHPLFALKAGDKRVREYTRGGVSVKVMPGTYGCATIHDKDVWIYCISQLVEGINRGREDVSRTVRFTAYDFLVTTNRPTNGGKAGGYERMAEAMGRLAGTRIETNIETAEIREREGFGLVDSWRVVEKKGGRMVAVEVTLPDWLFRSVQARQVLTLSPNYFRIRKSLDRRIYELARKHCGSQKQWQCSVVALHEKSGSTDTVRKLRAALKVLAEADQLPDYSVTFEDAHDVVIFRKR
jgi:plasmid replication initiation protein